MRSARPPAERRKCWRTVWLWKAGVAANGPMAGDGVTGEAAQLTTHFASAVPPKSSVAAAAINASVRRRMSLLRRTRISVAGEDHDPVVLRIGERLRLGDVDHDPAHPARIVGRCGGGNVMA